MSALIFSAQIIALYFLCQSVALDIGATQTRDVLHLTIIQL